MKHQGLPGFMLGSPKSFRIDFLRYFRYNIPVFALQKFSGQWDLIYKEEFESRSDAIAREKQLKSHRGREFLKNLIRNNKD